MLCLMVDKYILFAVPFERRAGDIMMWRKLGRKKAARCLAFMLALSLVFPGTVHAAFAVDGTPNEEVYSEDQEPSDGLLDENEAMEAEAAGQIDDLGLLTGDGTAADALSAEEAGDGAEENEIIPETGDENLFPEDETGEAGDEAALTEDEADGSQWDEEQAAETDQPAEDYEDPAGAETDGSDADGELTEADQSSTEEDPVLSEDDNTDMDVIEDMPGEETDVESGEETGEAIDGETAAEAGEGIEEDAGEASGEEQQEDLQTEESQEKAESSDEAAGSAEADSTITQEAGEETGDDGTTKAAEEAAKAAEEEKAAQAVTTEEQAAVPAAGAGEAEVNKITSISLKDEYVSPVLGVQGINTYQMELVVKYDTATSYETNEPYYFRSSNESVLKVDGKGLLTAVAAGSATIYVYTKTAGGQKDWLSLYCYVSEKAFQVKFNLNGGTLKSTDSLYKEGKIRGRYLSLCSEFLG